jgi:hypothetical protein
VHSKGGLAVLVAAALSTVTFGARADSSSDLPEDAARHPRAGVVQGDTKLSLAFEYAGVGSEHAWRLGGEFEHMLRNRWGLFGSLSIPVRGPWVVPSTLGLRVHALPGHAIDPYVKVGGGFAWVNPTNVPADIVPTLAMRLGVSLYSTGPYYLEGEAGYDFVHYSHGGLGFDLGGVVVTGRTGFSF